MDSPVSLSLGSVQLDPAQEPESDLSSVPDPILTSQFAACIAAAQLELESKYQQENEPVLPIKTITKLLDGERLVLDRLNKANTSGVVPCMIFLNPSSGILGQCVLTNYRVSSIQIYIELDNPSFCYENRIKVEFFDIPHLMICRMDRFIDKNYNIIEISTKDGRFLRVGFPHEVHNEYNLYSLMYSCTYGQSIKNRFAFYHLFPCRINGWKIYDPHEDFQRMGLNLTDPECPFVGLNNAALEICETYPDTVFVPRDLKLEAISGCANFRTRNRFPALVWINKEKTASLWRSSQPRTGIRTSRSLEDEAFIKQILNTSHCKKQLNIFDARPLINAHANRAFGGGLENKANYEGIEIQFLNIANIHNVREAWNGMIAAFSGSSSKFLSTAEKSGWQELTSAVMLGGAYVANSLSSGIPALIHCSDGWDRTAQLCSLAQLYLDDHYRTVKGFCQLIEKDWVIFGHQFERRFGHASPNMMDDQRSPIFIQFLDSIFQLISQYPTHFEFNEKLLLDIIHFLLSGRFGTFYCNSHRERYRSGVIDCTRSIWSWVLSKESVYTNPYYQPGQVEPLIPVTSVRSMVIWTALFGKWQSDFFYHAPHIESGKQHMEELMKNTMQGVNLYKELIVQKDAKIVELRKQLAELQGYEFPDE
jgi:myotubularin-related protein 1/2